MTNGAVTVVLKASHWVGVFGLAKLGNLIVSEGRFNKIGRNVIVLVYSRLGGPIQWFVEWTLSNDKVTVKVPPIT